MNSIIYQWVIVLMSYGIIYDLNIIENKYPLNNN